jgi:hypothetical protein
MVRFMILRVRGSVEAGVRFMTGKKVKWELDVVDIACGRYAIMVRIKIHLLVFSQPMMSNAAAFHKRRHLLKGYLENSSDSTTTSCLP